MIFVFLFTLQWLIENGWEIQNLSWMSIILIKLVISLFRFRLSLYICLFIFSKLSYWNWFWQWQRLKYSNGNFYLYRRDKKTCSLFYVWMKQCNLLLQYYLITRKWMCSRLKQGLLVYSWKRSRWKKMVQRLKERMRRVCIWNIPGLCRSLHMP